MLLIRIHLCIPPDATTELDSVARVLERLQKASRGRARLMPVLWHDLPLNAAAALSDDVAVVLSDDHGVDLSVFVLGETLGFDGELRQPNEDGEYYESAVEAEFALMTAAHAASPDGRPLILVYRRRVLRPVGVLLEEEDEAGAGASEPALTPAEEADTPVGVFAEGALAAAAGSLAANERFDGPADLEALLELHLGHCLKTLLGADAEAEPEADAMAMAEVAADADAEDAVADTGAEAGGAEEAEFDGEEDLEWEVDALDDEVEVEDKYRVLAEAEAEPEEEDVDPEPQDDAEDEEDAEDAADEDELLSVDEISSQIAAQTAVDSDDPDEEDENKEGPAEDAQDAQNEGDPAELGAIIEQPESTEEVASEADVIERAFAAHSRGPEPAPAPLPGESAAQDSATWKLIAAVLVLIVGLVLFADGFRQRKLAADATAAADHAREATKLAREQADAAAGSKGGAVALPNEFITLPGDPADVVPPALPPTEAALAADLAATREDLGQALLSRAAAYRADNDPLRAAIAAERAVGYATTGWRTEAPRLLSPLARLDTAQEAVQTMADRQTLGYPEAVITTGFSISDSSHMATSPTAGLLAAGEDSLSLWNLTTGALEATLLDGKVKSIGFSVDGATLMAEAWDGRVYVWDMATRQARPVFRSSSTFAHGVALSPDGGTIAVATDTESASAGAVELRSAANGKLERVLSVAGTRLTMPQFSPGGRYLACSTHNGSDLLLWTLQTGARVTVSSRISGGFGSIPWAWSPDGQQLAIITKAGGIDRYVLAGGKTDTQLTKALGAHRARSVAWMPGSALLAVGCQDGTVQVIDTATGTLQAAFEGLGGEAIALHPSHDGQRLVIKTRNGAPRVWDVATRQPLGLNLRQGGSVKASAYSPDGALLATAGEDGQLRLWESATGRQVATFGDFNDDAVIGLAFDKLGSRLVSLTVEGKVTVWEAKTGKAMSRRTLPNWQPIGSSISASASRIAYVNKAGECVVTNVANGTQAVIRKLAAPNDTMVTALSSDGDLLAISQANAPVELWNVNRQALLKELDEPGHGNPAFAFSGDGQRLALCAKSGEIHLWDLDSDTLVDSLTEFSGAKLLGIRRLALNHDGSQMAIPLNGGDLILWEHEIKRATRLVGHRDRVSTLAFSPDSRHLASGGDSGDLRLWNTDPSLPLADLPGHVKPITGLAFDERSGTLASTSQDGTIRLWDFRSGKLRRVLGGFNGSPYGLAFIPRADASASPVLAVLDHRSRASLIDCNTGEVLSRLTADLGAFFELHTLGNGEILLSGFKNDIAIWNPAQGTHYRLPGTKAIHVAVSPDSDKLAVYRNSSSLRLYDISTPQTTHTPRLLAELPLSGFMVRSLAFSPSGQTLAAGYQNGSVGLWNCSTGKSLGEIRGHKDAVFAIAFSPDKKHFASAGFNSTIRLMDMGGGRQTRVLSGHEGTVRTLQFSAGGRVLVSAGDDATIRYWDANTGRLLRIISADPATSTVADAPATTDSPATTTAPAAPDAAPATTEDALPDGVTESPAATAATDPATSTVDESRADAASSEGEGDGPVADRSDSGSNSGLYTQIPDALLDFRFDGADVQFRTQLPNLYVGSLGYHRRYGWALPTEAELATLPAPVRAELDGLVQADLAWRRSHDWPAPQPLPGALVEPREAPITMPVEFVDFLLQQDADDAAALEADAPEAAQDPAPAPAPAATPTAE